MGIEQLRALAWPTIATGLAAALLQPFPVAAQASNPSQSATERSCPAQLDAVAKCYSGRDANGAWYLAAVPSDWNRRLVVHAHGGPRLGTPKAEDSDEDLERFAAMVRSGYAWIGSTYRRGGYGVRMAAEDVDNSREIFWKQFGKPALTILHGQSYGGNVAAKLAELRTLDGSGKKFYDGVLLTNGVLSGGTQAYGFRADLRAVYQFFCRNHPRAGEVQYPLWQGLPKDSKMTRAELRVRVNECTGVELDDAARTPEQRRRLSAITGATGIDSRQLSRHLEWATFTFQDLVQLRLDGRNPFDNSQRRYSGSGDDDALNKGVERFAADPKALTALKYDSDLSGQIAVPTLAIHWKDDPIVFASADIAYEKLVQQQGNSDLFLRLTTNKGTHSNLLEADYLSALGVLADWIQSGRKPEMSKTRDICKALASDRRSECSLNP